MSATRLIIHAPHLGPKEWPGLAPTPPQPRPEPPYEPTVVELASNFAGAMGRVAVAALSGKRVKVTLPEYIERAKACGACEYWQPEAYQGIGRCAAPGCGCTKLKRWLPTEICRHPKGSRWAALDV